MSHMLNEKQIFVQKQLINKSSFQKFFILQKEFVLTELCIFF